MYITAKKNVFSRLRVRCLSILLVAAICLLDVPLSFAAFNSISKNSFVASVTIGGADVDNDKIPDFYDFEPNSPYNAWEDADANGFENNFTNLEEYRIQAVGKIVFNNLLAPELIASPSSGVAAQDVAFIISDGSSDVIKYELDFDGNGTYDWWCYKSNYSPITYKYTAAGAYNVKLRVTDNQGYIAIDATTVNIAKNVVSPTANTEFNLIAGNDGNGIDIPESLRLNASPYGSNRTAIYEWDTTGNGEYDTVSKKSASIIKFYNDTTPRSFNARFRVTDSQGLSDIGTVGIVTDASMWVDSQQRPVIWLAEYVIDGVSVGESVLLGEGGSASIAGGSNCGYIRKLEWDFEGDGINDWSATPNNNLNWNGSNLIEAAHIYNAPGVYRAIITVHTEAEISTQETVLVIVSGSEPVTTRANASVTYASNQDRLPANAKFEHKQSVGTIVQYEWDFDGDKKIDKVTTNKNEKYNYKYCAPGYYVAMLRVTDSDGFTDTDYISAYVREPLTGHTGDIKIPSDGESVSGNHVTVCAEIYPDNVTISDVRFQYKGLTQAVWTDITDGPITTTSSYLIPWDTTQAANGDYELRAIIKGEDPSDFDITTVSVDNSGAVTDVYEYKIGSTHTKTVIVDPDEANKILMPDGSTIDIPKGAIPHGANSSITITQNLDATIGQINFTVTGIEKFLKDVTVTVYYDDQNDDGIVDGTNVHEETLSVVWFDDQGNTVKLYNSVVHPDENFVTAQTDHFSGIGLIGIVVAGIIGGAGGAASSGGSTASYCFIATAAYGTPMADDVLVLREFRDKYLMRSYIGREFVWNYYRYSPPIAKFISNKPALKRITRFLLKPFVKFAKKRQ